MKSQRVFLFVSVLAILALLSGTAYASTFAGRRDFTEVPFEATQTEYAIVIFKDPPAASYEGGIPGLERTKPERGGRFDPNSPAYENYRRHLENAHGNYRSWLARNLNQAEVVDEYFVTLNGLAIKLNGARAERLLQGPGVERAAHSWLYQPTMNVSTGLIGATTLWPQLGGQANAGSGIKVGVIDSGIDDTHPFFACKSEITHKVFASGVAGGGEDIVNEHGTHVAGTVAGCVTTLTDGPVTGDISGVAPGADLFDYNVFPGYGAGFVAFGGSALSHDIVDALEEAVLDGMDVVNMSLSGGVQGPHDLLADAVNATVDAGVVVAVAAGNAGPGDATVGSPGSAANALTAGASTNPHFLGIPVSGTDANGNAFSYGAALGDFANFGAFNADYTVTTPAHGCSAISEDLTGKVALIDRGVCSFTTKIRNAEAKGAVGVLVVNNSAGDPIAMGHDGSTPFPGIPAAMLGVVEGNAIKPSGNVTFTGADPAEVISNNADILAGFSSRGPSPYNWLIKPDITAPGVNVYSSVFEGEFAMFQGTSMASPHLAGSAALVLDMFPDWSPADVKSALVNTAARVVTDHVTGTTDPGVLARGNGRVDLAAAVGIPVTIDPVSASFGYWTGNKPLSASLDLRLYDVSDGATCTVAVSGPAIVSAAEAQVDVPDGGSASLTLLLDGGRADTTPTGDYSGDVELTCDGTTLLVPWWVRVNREAKP